MHNESLHKALAGIIRDAFFDARNANETMYQASDVAASRVIATLTPSMLRLNYEVDQLLKQWEIDRRGYPTGTDWQAAIADITVKHCIAELQEAVRRAGGLNLTMESVEAAG
jgi:hypothetical protein